MVLKLELFYPLDSNHTLKRKIIYFSKQKKIQFLYHYMIEAFVAELCWPLRKGDNLYL